LFVQFLTKQLHVQKFIFPTILFLCIVINLYTYLNYYKDLGKIYTVPSVLQTIKKQNPTALYGVNDITPALAYMTNTPLLNGIVDTNESIFRKHFLHADILTRDAIQKNAMIITHGASYPQANINEKIIDEIVNKDMIKKHCTLVTSFPVFTEGVINQLNLFQCTKTIKES
jgi:hypothetical protein